MHRFPYTVNLLDPSQENIGRLSKRYLWNGNSEIKFFLNIICMSVVSVVRTDF